MKKIGSLLPVILIAAGLAFYFIQRPHAFYGDAVQPGITVQDFTLTGVHGPVSLHDFRGKQLVILFFGYTYCPDVCPSTLVNLRQAMQQLGPSAGAVQVVMVSVDPDRDTPEVLANYVANFDPSFVGITGTKDQIDPIASANDVFYEIKPGISPDDYLISHTATLLVLDADRNLMLRIPFGNTPAQIADDLKYLLK